MSLHVVIVKKCLSVIPANPMSKLCMKAWQKGMVADLSFNFDTFLEQSSKNYINTGFSSAERPRTLGAYINFN